MMLYQETPQADAPAEHPKSGKSRRGFAAMSPEKQREIASKGGRAAHEKGTAHEFDSHEARRAGQKGGQAVSRDRRHMAEIGRKGGESSHGRAIPQRDRLEKRNAPPTEERVRQPVANPSGEDSDMNMGLGSRSDREWIDAEDET